MFVRRYQWMGMISAVLTLLLLSDSLIVQATETGTLIGDGTTEAVEQYEVNEDEIWALIDRDELRSLIDVDALKDSIDLEILRKKVDKEPLMEQISDVKLLESMSAEEILRDFNSLKEKDELDDLIREVLESDEFDEEYIKNKPIAVPNVKIPITDGNSPLDYIVDPMGLIYNTEAAKYGGGSVQEGANVLFRNTEGDYLFSDTSDMLKIVNKGTVPLQVTISAEIDNGGDVELVESSSMLDGLEPGLFMTLVGKDGLLSVLSENGNSEITVVLDAVPEGTYTYKRDEETGEYISEISENADESKFASFSFGLRGECNSEANWSRVQTLPRVVVTWHTEPILTGWDEITDKLEETDKVKFEAYKKVKLQELRDNELERLIQIQIDDMIYEELDKLIDEEVEMLAQTRFDELKELAIRGELDLETGRPLNSDDMLILDDAENAEDADGEGDAIDENGRESDAGDGIEESGTDVNGEGDAEGNEEVGTPSEAGVDFSARAGNKSAVLGATRDRIEFMESSDYDDPGDHIDSQNYDETSERDEVDDLEQFEERAQDQIQNQNQEDDLIIFGDDEKKTEEVIIF